MTARPNWRTFSPTYRSWSMMIQRCTNPKREHYCEYGGRGIRVCERWLESFDAFLADMGERPDGTSLDRIDVNGNYEPGNCRWATKKQQSRNTRATRWLEHDGKRLSLVEWSEITGLRTHTIAWRLARGWPMAKALTQRSRQERAA